MNEGNTVFRHAHNRENPYAQIARNTLQDKRLSWKARGLLSYLLSKPNNWRISFAHLVKEAPDGKASLQTAINELRKYGYLTKRPIRDTKGRIVQWENLIHEHPILVEEPELHPESDFRDLDKREVDNPELDNTPLHNKESTKQRKKQNRDINNNKNNVVVDEGIQNIIEEVEQHLGTSVHSLLPLLATWIQQHGEQYLLERAKFARQKAKTNVVGLFRMTIENDWDIQKLTLNSTDTRQDKRYANFYELFPDA